LTAAAGKQLMQSASLKGISMSHTATIASTAHKTAAAEHQACAEHHLKAAQCHDAADTSEAQVNAAHAMKCCQTATKNTATACECSAN
jgi:hypothetical protein